jgi:transposase
VNHVAIDLGSKESQVCIRDATGTLQSEGKYPTKGLMRLMRAWPPSRVILETSSESFRVADQAREAGHEVRVVPATLVRQLGVGERGVKTDKRDARKLSEVSCRVELPSVWIPSATARQRRSMLRSHEALTASRTQLTNHVRGWMRQHLLKTRATPATLPDAVRVAARNAEPSCSEHVRVGSLNFRSLVARRGACPDHVAHRPHLKSGTSFLVGHDGHGLRRCTAYARPAASLVRDAFVARGSRMNLGTLIQTRGWCGPWRGCKPR